MKKIYLTPAVRLIDLVEEGVIATSSVGVYNENIGEEFTQQKEENIWGNEDIWK